MAAKKSGPGASASRRKKTKKPTTAKAAVPSAEAAPQAHACVSRPLRTIADLAAGDHLCCIYETEAEHRAILTPYLRLGLERGEKILYVVDAHTADTVLGYLRNDGLDPEPFVARGQLSILSRDETYLRGGTFYPTGMIALLRKETEQALAEGYAALRVTGEMTWALRGHPGSERLIQYEILLNEFFPGSRCHALCQYDRRRFEPGVLLYVLRTHPYVAVGADVCENPHYLPSTDLLSADSSAAELRRWMQGLKERRQAEEALRFERDRAQRYLDLAGTALVGIAADQTTTLVNRKACELLGRTQEELLGRNWFDTALPVHERDEIRALFVQLIRGEVQPVELVVNRLVTNDGEERIVRWHNTLVRDAAGAITATLSSGEDITDRRRAEDALRDSERRFGALFDQSPLSVQVLDASGKTIQINRAFEDLWGTTFEETQAFNPLEDEQLDGLGLRPFLQRAFAGEPVECPPVEYTPRAGDVEGHRRVVHTLAYPIKDASGTVREVTLIHQDITDRKQAEDALRESEERYRTLVESALDAIVLVADGRIVFANPAAAALLGSPGPAEVIGIPLERYVHHDEVAGTKERIQRVLAGEAIAYPVETRYVKHDGAVLVVETSGARTTYKGRPAVLAVVRDITGRKHAEEALTHSHDLMRYVIEHNRSAVAVHDRELKYLYVSQRYLDDYKVKEQDVIGKHHYDVFPDLPQKWRDVHQKALAGEVSSAEDDPYVRDDGTVDWTRWECRPWYQADGAIGGIIVYTEVITARKRAEAALRESEERHRHVVESSDGWIWETDANAVITYSSDRVRDLTGFTPEEVVGRTAYDLMPPEDTAAARAAFRPFVAERKPFHRVENIFLHKDGRRIVMESNGVPLFDASGAFRGYRGVDTDVTEQRLLQAEFVQAQKLESVGRLAGGIAHDFNNLLSVINGYAELAAMDRSLSNSQRAQVVAIHRAGERAAALTRQLLSFSRRQAVAPVILDLNAEIRTVEKMLARLIGEDVVLVFAPMEPLGGVEADPGQIEQVVMNLAVNARDAMPAGGMLSIETASVDLDRDAAERAAVPPGPYVTLAVSDTGVGMDEATRTHLFEPFFTTKDPGKGTGLGLAIVYGIVRQSRGGIRVASILGQGTTFTIYLPRVEAAVPAEAAAALAPAAGGTETILIVEDEETVRALAANVLESAGYTVLQARHGDEALAVLERHDGTVDLVLTDIVMPEMGGMALAEELTRTHPRIRVLFTSGYESGSLARGGVPDGATHFIAKPYSVASLLRKVREVLDWPL